MRTVKEIKVTRSFSGGHAIQLAKGIAKVGGAGFLGIGVAVVTGALTSPLVLPVAGAIALLGIAKGVDVGKDMDRATIREMELPESEWRRVPELNEAIRNAIANGKRKMFMTVKEETECLSTMQEFLAGGKGYVNVEYRVKIKYA